MSDLIGRSRNERKLDGIYNKQRNIIIDKIKKKRENDIYSELSKKKKKENVPFPEIYEKKRKINDINLKVDENKETKQKFDLYNAINVIINKHIYSKNKFIKCINVFINLCIHYMNNENKYIFFHAFDKINKVFLEHYIYNFSKNNIYSFYKYDELHIKYILLLFDKVINKIIDKRFIIMYKSNNEKEDKINEYNKLENENNSTEKNESLIKKEYENIFKDNLEKLNNKKNILELTKIEKQFLKLLKIKIYYLVILFKLNDNFIFNKLMIIYKQIFEEIQNEYNIYEKEEINIKENYIKNNEINDDDDNKDNNNNNENNNNNDKNENNDNNDNNDKNNDNNDKNENNNKNENNDNNDNNDDNEKEQWTIPTHYQIFKLKRNAFVKCLSNLFNFINIPWAKTSIEILFQNVYQKKYIFDKCDEIIIENLQSSIKANSNKKIKTDTHHVLSIGESLNPIVDARDEKIVSIHGSHVWSSKQMDH